MPAEQLRTPPFLCSILVPDDQVQHVNYLARGRLCGCRLHQDPGWTRLGVSDIVHRTWWLQPEYDVKEPQTQRESETQLGTYTNIRCKLMGKLKGNNGPFNNMVEVNLTKWIIIHKAVPKLPTKRVKKGD